MLVFGPPGKQFLKITFTSTFPILSDLAFKPFFTEEVQIAIPIMKPTLDKVQLAGQALPPGFPAPFLFADGLSSVETLLTNIQVSYSL